MSELIAVTGATGVVGGATARSLVEDGARVRVIGRKRHALEEFEGAECRVIPDFSADAELREALDGVSTLLFVAARDTPNRVDVHRKVVRAASAAGVGHVVYTSMQGAGPVCHSSLAREHWHTEEALRGAGLSYTFLRPNFFHSAVVHMIGEDGVIRGPAGAGRLAPVAQADLSAVAARVLLEPGRHHAHTYHLTGPDSLSFYDIAKIASRYRVHPVRYEEETIDEAYASRQSFGVSRDAVTRWINSYLAIANDEVSDVSQDVQRITQTDPQSFDEYLSAN